MHRCEMVGANDESLLTSVGSPGSFSFDIDPESCDHEIKAISNKLKSKFYQVEIAVV